MSNNCLVTKLKGVVDNDNLPVYGEFNIGVTSFSAESNARFLAVGCTDTVHITCSDGGSVDGRGSDFDLPAGVYTMTVSFGDFNIRITPKYNISVISLGFNSFIKNIEHLCYVQSPCIINQWTPNNRRWGIYSGDLGKLSTRPEGSIELSSGSLLGFGEEVYGSINGIRAFDTQVNYSIDFGSSKVEGDLSVFANPISSWIEHVVGISFRQAQVGKVSGNIEVFKDFVNIEAFDINYISTTGSLTVTLGNMTKLNIIAVGGHTQAENLTSLFDTLHSNGRTSGSIACWIGSNKTITIDGNTIPFQAGSTVNFDASGWTYVPRS